MGVDIRHTNEEFEILSEILDPENNFERLFGGVGADTSKYPNIAGIDLYGNTVFNQYQLKRLLPEFEGFIKEIRDEELKKWLDEVVVLLRKAKGQIHTYVMFVGD